MDWRGFITAGGIEQWVSIRGASADNPGLLFLHGGPGEALSVFPEITAAWERDYTVVHWDQRGAGKTYGRKRSTPADLTLERLAQDAIDVAEFARNRLGKRKLVLVGQSWGSCVGWRAAQMRPDLFLAYVGTGQAVGWQRSMEWKEENARAKAVETNDKITLEKLEASRKLPISDPARLGRLKREWFMDPSDLDFIEMQRRVIGQLPFPEKGDIADWLAGFDFSAQALWKDTVAFDLYPLPRLGVPLIVIQGREDRITPFPLAERFIADVRAPSKSLVPVGGGHFTCYVKPELFAQALTRHIPR